MPSVHTFRKIALRIILFALLAAVSDVTIFHRRAAVNLLRADVSAYVSHEAFEIAAAILLGLALLGILIVVPGVARSIASLVRKLWAAPAPYGGLEPKDRIAAENALRTNHIQIITTIVQSLGGIAVLTGIYFAWANLRNTQRTQAETLRLTNEGQITERFTKAIDQLGATDNQGQPRLELRLGGIYALERIARESKEDHWPIMEVLTTYVRVHAPVQKTHDKQLRIC
jgi:hypothetical protein